jgi:glycosyltransferase involved in cell wall biosynthesis
MNQPFRTLPDTVSDATPHTSGASTSPAVAVLLCSMNGEKFLAAQLDSIKQQNHTNWKVWASDDGSSDNTLSLLNQYFMVWGKDKIAILPGPRQGYVVNFLSLLCRSEIQADYYALSDQDDIWAPGKISRALQWHASIPPDVPALYCSRTQLINETGEAIGFSPLFPRPPAFGNALMQSLAGGNTMVINEAARALIRKAGVDVAVPSHDWWLYLVVSACGGRIFYDPVPEILYRQHGLNLIGSNKGFRAMLNRLSFLLKGQHREWSERNIAALNRLKNDVTPQNRKCLERFQHARQAPLMKRLWGFLRAGLYRQTMAGNATLWLAVVLRRI